MTYTASGEASIHAIRTDAVASTPPGQISKLQISTRDYAERLYSSYAEAMPDVSLRMNSTPLRS